mmetsp:Transcript_30358/g.55003  ORF Transcript_30358/g.55003 Transcript_30358/m.55003 type:complete len:327 (-) Transcript_30358:333-1313(-)
MPESGHAVRCKKRTTSTNVDILCQPISRLLVPSSTQSLEVWCRFKLNHINVVRYLPSLGLPLGVKSFKSSIPNIVRPFSILPGKVVFESNEEEGQPRISETFKSRFGQHFFTDNYWGGILRIRRIQERVHSTPSHKDAETQETAKEGAHCGPYLAGDLSFRLSRLVVQKRSIASVGIKLVLVCRTSEDSGKAEGITQVFNNSRERMDGNTSTFLCSPVFLSFVNQFSIIKIVSKRVELHGEHHLRSSEVHIPPKVIDILTVQVAGGDVSHHENRHQCFGCFGGKDEEHDIDEHRTDQLMDPLDSNCKLKQKRSQNEGKQMLHLSVG